VFRPKARLTWGKRLIQFANVQHLLTRVLATLAADRSVLALVGAAALT